MLTWLGLAILIFIAGLALLYNRLVRSRNRVDTAWSDIDVQLQRRHDLIPQLVTAVQAYAKYERATLEAVSRLRSEAMKKLNIDQRARAEEKLSSAIKGLLAMAEDYAEIKANENFLLLQDQLIESENHLQFARRYYNGSVRDYNTMTETVPSNVVAGWFNFRPRSFFQKTADETGDTPIVKTGTGK